MMDSEQAKETANALLATVKKVMTGREIEACQWTRTDEFEDDVFRMEYGHEEGFYDHDEDGAPEFDPFGDIRWKWSLLESLSIQFSREIGNWINKRNAARARKTITV